MGCRVEILWYFDGLEAEPFCFQTGLILLLLLLLLLLPLLLLLLLFLFFLLFDGNYC